MSTITFSIDEETKREIARIAKAEKKSKSDVFRDVWASQKFCRTLDKAQATGRLKAMARGLETVNDFERYLG